MTEKINIEWKYFFGGSSKNTFDRYYKAEINNIRIEKHASHNGIRYAIGNIDEAKNIYKTEGELLNALKYVNTPQNPLEKYGESAEFLDHMDKLKNKLK